MDFKEAIVVSGDFGCSAASFIVLPYYKNLQAVFREYCMKRYFNSLTHLSIVLRVSGTLADFGGEGPERLQLSMRRATIDLVIPESRWRDVDEPVLREYVASQVKACFELLVGRANKAKEIIDENALRSDFQAAMAKFRTL